MPKLPNVHFQSSTPPKQPPLTPHPTGCRPASHPQLMVLTSQVPSIQDAIVHSSPLLKVHSATLSPSSISSSASQDNIYHGVLHPPYQKLLKMRQTTPPPSPLLMRPILGCLNTSVSLGRHLHHPWDTNLSPVELTPFAYEGALHPPSP